MKDTEIIELLKADNIRKSVKGLYAFYPGIRKFITANNGSNEDAEDIFQEVLLLLYQKVRQTDFILTASLKTYAFSIAKNLWYAELRRKGKEVSIDETLADADTSIQNESERQKLAEDAFGLLGEKCKQLLILFYYKKMSLAEIARKLEFSNEHVAKNQKYRCLEKANHNFQTLLNNR